MRPRIPLHYLILASTLLAVSSPLSAQDETVSTEPATSVPVEQEGDERGKDGSATTSPNDETSTETTESTKLAPVTVTGLREKGYIPKNSVSGTKSVMPIIEAPQSISVITADQMTVQGVQGMDDAVKYSSGVIGNPYGFDQRTDWIYVRGFEPTRYIDGLAMPDGVWTGVTRWETYGFERVEVLKGASSALYGPMPVGGLVNATTKRPTFEPFGEASVSYGSFHQAQGKVDLGGPLNSEGTVLYRLTGVVREGETVLDYSKDDRQFVAPAITWLINEDTHITILTRYQHDESRGLLGFLPADGTMYYNPNGKIPISRYTGEPDFDYYKKDLWTAGYEFEHRFNDSWFVRQNLRGVGADVDQNLVGTLGLQADQRTVNRYTWTPEETSYGITIDTQIGGKMELGPITNEILFGVDYLYAHTDASSGMGFDAPTLDIYNPIYGSPVNTPADSTHTVQKQDTVGVYLQDQVKFEKILLTLGIRQDFVSLRSDDRMGTADQTRDDQRLSGRAGLSYVFDFGLAPYVAWSTSFQSNLGTDYSGNTFSPTKGDLYEVGIKYQPKEFNALFTLAAYQSTLKDILTTDNSAPIFGYMTQQGKTRIRGFEAEARVSPLRGLNLIAAYTYTDSEIRETSVATDLGKQLPLVPKNRLSAWADYTFPQGFLKDLGFGMGVTYNTAVYGDSSNLYKGDSSTIWDAVMHYEYENWRFQVNATNIFDKRYVAVVQSSMWAYYGAPRTITASITYRF
ncbi:MAG: TonB-dependent siderophore receptor [Puniceicoccales bacterium]|jgi:iron complex outermembrane receptor protein|nr:TonB-dependent siderophore receptor [Puniceicoccales bacterium]